MRDSRRGSRAATLLDGFWPGIIMKLIGSLTEAKIREEVICSQMQMMVDQDVIAILLGIHGDIASVIALSYIPEQGEDLITVLVDDDTILSLEIDRISHCGRITHETTPDAYMKGKKRREALHLVIALEEARKKL